MNADDEMKIKTVILLFSGQKNAKLIQYGYNNSSRNSC
jgi:hypothetical protein